MTLAWLRYDGTIWYLLLAFFALGHFVFRVGQNLGYARCTRDMVGWMKEDIEMRDRLLDKPEAKKDARLH